MPCPRAAFTDSPVPKLVCGSGACGEGWRGLGINIVRHSAKGGVSLLGLCSVRNLRLKIPSPDKMGLGGGSSHGSGFSQFPEPGGILAGETGWAVTAKRNWYWRAPGMPRSGGDLHFNCFYFFLFSYISWSLVECSEGNKWQAFSGGRLNGVGSSLLYLMASECLLSCRI